MEADITVKAELDLPLTSGKMAKLTLENDEVKITTPVSWKVPTVRLDDLEDAVAGLSAARARVVDGSGA